MSQQRASQDQQRHPEVIVINTGTALAFMAG